MRVKSCGQRAFETSSFSGQSFQLDNKELFLVVATHNQSWLAKLKGKTEISGHWSLFNCSDSKGKDSCILSLDPPTFSTPVSFLGYPSFWAERETSCWGPPLPTRLPPRISSFQQDWWKETGAFPIVSATYAYNSCTRRGQAMGKGLGFSFYLDPGLDNSSGINY